MKPKCEFHPEGSLFPHTDQNIKMGKLEGDWSTCLASSELILEKYLMTGKESPADESQNKHPLPGLRCWGRVMLPYCMASRSGLQDQIIDRQLFVIFLSVWVSKQICSHCHERSSGLGGACFQSTPLGCNSKSLQRVHQLKGNGVRPWCDLC